MSPSTIVYRFGDVEFDPLSGRVFRGTACTQLSATQSAILAYLIAHRGEVISKDTLAEVAWRTQAVTDECVKQTLSRLRRSLSAPAPEADAQDRSLIETIPRSGYRFSAPVARADRSADGGTVGAGLTLSRAYLRGEAALHSLRRDRFDEAERAFLDVLHANPAHVNARVGMANLCALRFDASRIDAVWLVGEPPRGVQHARTAIERAPLSGDAWSALAFCQFLTGDIAEAAAAAEHSVDLEPDNWRHWLRLGYVSWGEKRIQAGRKMLRLYPAPFAYWLIATTLIGRGLLETALDVLRDGCAAQDSQVSRQSTFPAMGLHFLRGLVLGAQNRVEDAADAMTRELSSLDHGQVYGRECAASSWYALGAFRTRQRRHADAESAFANALTVAPAHLSTNAALGRRLPSVGGDDPRAVGVAMARAAALARAGRHGDAARIYGEAVRASSLPSAGWILAVEPLIVPAAHPDVWADTLAVIRQRSA